MYDEDAYACDLAPEFAGIVDDNGKPQYTGAAPARLPLQQVQVRRSRATRRRAGIPAYWMCITDAGDPNGNTFSVDSRKFLNFENTDPTDPPSTDINAHDCPTRFGTQLARARSRPSSSPTCPAAAAIRRRRRPRSRAICADYSGTTINREALQYNCQCLSQYNLFADPTDPRASAERRRPALRPDDPALLRLRDQVPLRLPAARRSRRSGRKAARARRTRRSTSPSAP